MAKESKVIANFKIESALTHKKGCSTEGKVHLVEYHRPELARTDIVLLCCECEGLTIHVHLAVVRALLDARRQSEQEAQVLSKLACFNCGGPRHIGWCGS